MHRLIPYPFVQIARRIFVNAINVLIGLLWLLHDDVLRRVRRRCPSALAHMPSLDQCLRIDKTRRSPEPQSGQRE